MFDLEMIIDFINRYTKKKIIFIICIFFIYLFGMIFFVSYLL